MEIDNGDAQSKLEDYEVVKQIGRGSYGASFIVLHKTEENKYVLKKIRLENENEKFKLTAHQEMSLIAKLSHPYIVEYKDAWVDKGCICTVTNYCEGGDMPDIMRKTRGALFPEEKVCKWLTQLLLALDYLHSHRVLHRDLKLSNIFLTKENDIRLGDFGLAKILDEGGLASSVAGTANYMCPELLDNIPYGYKSDVWSLGCCIFEIAARQAAFRASDMNGLISKINRCAISPLPVLYSSSLKQIIKSMLRKSPEHRPTAAELLRHAHLQPYILRCHNPSSVFLPVKSPNTAKEKGAKSSPRKSSGGKDSSDTIFKLRERRVLPFDDRVEPQLTILRDDKQQLIHDKPETKRVDPTSCPAKVFNDTDDSRSGDTSCETIVCNGDYQDNSDTSSQKETQTANSSCLLSNSHPGDIEKSSPDCILQFEDGDMDVGRIEDWETLDSQHVSEEPLRILEDPSFDMNKSSVTAHSDKAASLDKEDTVITVNVRAVGDSDPVCDTDEVEGNAGSTERPPENVTSDKIEDKPSCSPETEVKAPVTGDTKQQPEKCGTELMNQDILLLKSLAANGHENKNKWENPSQQRADALEALLELCARLLKQNKLDELAGVLKPFGDDTVSSRETAIWLTKSLINAQKLVKGS